MQLIYGVGYLGIGLYNTQNKKAYSVWMSMLKRCYSKKFQELQPTYKKCFVDEYWHNFQNFAEWFNKSYSSEIMTGWQLDKDLLLKGNKIYTSETCCFVPHEINSLFTGRNSKRGVFPIGVSIKRSKYQANINIGEITKYLGTFNNPEEAFQAYKTAKEKHIKEVADKWKGLISEQVYQAIYNYEVEITD